MASDCPYPSFDTVSEDEHCSNSLSAVPSHCALCGSGVHTSLVVSVGCGVVGAGVVGDGEGASVGGDVG